MNNVFKVVGSVASAALLLSGAATAAPPQAFGTWSVSSTGVISGAGCAGQVVGTGFLQCQMTIGGKTYIQTIIAEGFAAAVPAAPVDPLSRLTFRSQDFVQIGAGSNQGVASTVGIKDSTTNPGTVFSTTAEIMAGWATSNFTPGSTTANKSEAVLTLNVDAPGSSTANDGFLSNFNVTAITDSTNVNRITALGLGQTVELGGTGTDRQRFELRQESANPAVTAYTVGGITANPLGGVLNAALNAPLRGLWIGQTVTGTDNFGVQSLSVVDAAGNPTSTTSLTSLGSTGPVDWGTGGVFTAQFGSTPTF